MFAQSSIYIPWSEIFENTSILRHHQSQTLTLVLSRLFSRVFTLHVEHVYCTNSIKVSAFFCSAIICCVYLVTSSFYQRFLGGRFFVLLHVLTQIFYFCFQNNSRKLKRVAFLVLTIRLYYYTTYLHQRQTTGGSCLRSAHGEQALLHTEKPADALVWT